MLVARCVSTVRHNRVGCASEPLSEGPSAAGVWCDAAAPVRLDLCGGWSDTPPITFEHGGKVADACLLSA